MHVMRGIMERNEATLEEILDGKEGKPFSEKELELVEKCIDNIKDYYEIKHRMIEEEEKARRW